MARIEAREHTNLTDHEETKLGKGMDKIIDDDDGVITFKGKGLSIAKNQTEDSENKNAEKSEDCKLKRCCCGFLIKDDSEEEEEDIDAEFYEVVVDEYKSYPYDLDKEFKRDLREAKKEVEAYLKAKKEREANGEAEPVHLPFWCQTGESY